MCFDAAAHHSLGRSYSTHACYTCNCCQNNTGYSYYLSQAYGVPDCQLDSRLDGRIGVGISQTVPASADTHAQVEVLFVANIRAAAWSLALPVRGRSHVIILSLSVGDPLALCKIAGRHSKRAKAL
jgi:hypothetical protein